MAEHSLQAVKVTCKPRKGGDVKLFQTPSYLSLDTYFQSQKPKSEQFGRKTCVMITHARGTTL